MGKLDGKVAIITGAASGLGRAGAILFAQEGAKVVAVDVNEQALHPVIAEIRAFGGVALASKTDVSRLADMASMASQAILAFGRIDILWNNAAVLNALYSSAEDITESEWNTALAVNLNGMFFGVKCVVPHMKAQKSGCIITTASIAGMVAHMPGRAAYCVSKGAIIALTRQLSLELGAHNIRVNAIAPGGINTGMSGRVAKPDTISFEYKRPETNDMTRRAEPIEVARTALFLAGDDLGPMTGVILPHDGGRSAQ